MARQAPGLSRITVLIFFAALIWAAGCESEGKLINVQGKNISTSAGATFINGTPADGRLYLLYPNSPDTSYIISYQDGKENGVYKTFYPGGKPRELRFFQKGWKQGEHKGWYEDGTPAFIYNFKDDVFEGSLKEWSSQGIIFRDMHFENGQEMGAQKIYYANGKIKSNYVIKNGVRYGLLGTKNCANVSDRIFSKK